MKGSDAKKAVIELIRADLAAARMETPIDLLPVKDDLKFDLGGKRVRTLWHRDGYYVNISPSWFVGGDEFPDVSESAFEVYAFAIQASPTAPVTSYSLVDQRRVRDWVLQYDSRDAAFRGERRWLSRALKPSSKFFVWAHETLETAEAIGESRRIEQRNVVSFLKGAEARSSAEAAKAIAATVKQASGSITEAPNDRELALIQAIRRLRRGAPTFRRNMLRLYGGRCAITGEGPEAVLEAAHIQDHSVRGLNSTENGLLLRSDIHVLFDLHLIKIEPSTLRIHVDSSLAGSAYADLAKPERYLRPRVDGSRPSKALLAERWVCPPDGDA